MIQKALLATGTAILVWFGTMAIVEAADARVVLAAPAEPIWIAERVENCSVFYEPYRIRGFGWGSGPGLGVGFGTFEGALPRYPLNSFPNWYGACQRWGRYSATGSAR